eukprot:Seg2823.2 transcript_id=Seg2823.2/GoldUCD/mRNA.D3Y31 product="hypothetical protein" protein_id=Seg2823.2/GoldUCD/D3Y31
MKQEAENHGIRSNSISEERRVSTITEESWDGNDSSGSQKPIGRTDTQKRSYNTGGHEEDSADRRNSVQTQESTYHKEETQSKEKKFPWSFAGAPTVQRQPKNSPRSEDAQGVRNVDQNINRKIQSMNSHKEQENKIPWLFSDVPKSQREPKSSPQTEDFIATRSGDKNSASNSRRSSSLKEQNTMAWLFSDTPKSSKETVRSNSNRKNTLSDESLSEFQFGQYMPSAASSIKPSKEQAMGAESTNRRSSSLKNDTPIDFLNDNRKEPEVDEQPRRRSSGRRRGQSGKDAADELKRLIEF